MFKLLLPLIDQCEINVSQSGNGLVIRSQPSESGGTVITTLRSSLSSNEERIRPSFRAKQPIQSNTLVGGSVVSKREFINHLISDHVNYFDSFGLQPPQVFKLMLYI